MTVSAKDLRFRISMLFDILTKGEEITITYRGKPKAKLVPFKEPEGNEKSDALFGIWKDQKGDVDEYVRSMRQGRKFDL
jgi:prevent-host-death family protein